jgi:hypothetical protein
VRVFVKFRYNTHPARPVAAANETTTIAVTAGAPAKKSKTE